MDESALLRAELRPIGWITNASNGALYCELDVGGHAVYKPRSEESPLWDFPDGTLCVRERAAFLLSKALGWNFVPPTVLREGPSGFGSVQLFIEHDEEQDLNALLTRDPLALERLAVFDVLANNADRKRSHCLLDPNKKLWAIDHGVCFHTDPKLRTINWAFAGKRLSDSLRTDIEKALEGDWAEGLLSQDELAAFERRLQRVRKTKTHASPDGPYSVPWPPW